MDFDPTDLQRQRYGNTLAAVSERLGRQVATGEQAADRSAWKVAAEIGLTGLCLPGSSGGGDLNALDTALTIEAFGRACPDTGLVFAVCAHLLACAVPIRDFGPEELRARLLPGLAAGDIIAANAMTEEDAGSDLSRLSVTAEADGDHYLLNGEKSFVSNSSRADVFVTYATTDSRAGFLGLTAFVVPRDRPGVEVEAPMEKMGLNSCPAGRVRFRQCRIPASHRLGDEGQGTAVFQHSMAWERGCLFAAYLGLMERQLEQCVRQATQRRQFGRSIGSFQAVSHRIAVMKQRLESSRLLVYRSAWLLDQGRAQAGAAALAKVATSEAAVANSLDAMQIFGAAGYLSATGVERQLRDSLPSRVFSGTNEVLLEIVAKDVGL